jgi:hypothetical protein
MGVNQRGQIVMSEEEVTRFLHEQRVVTPATIGPSGRVVEMTLHKRIAFRVDAERIRSWDHRKLGLDPLPLGGSTAAYL